MPICSQSPILEHCGDLLSEQMTALGLPLSFNSSKRMIAHNSKSKKKSTPQSYIHDSLCIPTSMQQNDEILDLLSSKSSSLRSHTHHLTIDEPQNSFIGKFCCWEAYWDKVYMKVYYYNVDTEESTWYPPPEIKSPVCMEDTTVDSNFSLFTKDIAASTCAIDLGNLGRILELPETQNSETVTLSLSYSYVQERAGCCYQHVIGTDSARHSKRNPNARSRRRRRMKTSVEIRGSEIESEETTNSRCLLDITKYWCQRYILFSRFDEGVKMDEEGWFSVTPEVIAAHHAVRCAGGCIVDCFAGVGGNSIQFACRGSHVIAVDIDPKKMEYARHNAAIYGCADRIDFVQGDFFVLAAGMKADKVFLSPPWGGPNYVDVETYDLDMLKPYKGQVLFHIAKEIAPVVVMFLPRTTKVYQLAELAASHNPHWNLEVEMNYLNGKMKAITAYFSRGS